MRSSPRGRHVPEGWFVPAVDTFMPVTISVILGGQLRNEAPGPQRREVELADRATVGELLHALDLRPERVHMIMVNGTGRTTTHELHTGDRVGLFPPELAYNTFVSLSFRQDKVATRPDDPASISSEDDVPQ